MKVSQWPWFFLVLVFSDACVEPLSVPVIREGRKLVVDGLISDGPGPYRVKLFMSPYQDEDETQTHYVSGALVKIIDDLGNEAVLVEDEPGEYITANNLQGVVGRKYQLDVQLSDGKHHQSSWEEIRPSGSIDNLYYEYHENDINENDPSKPQDALWIYVDATGIAGDQNLLRWRWQGTFHTHTYPELRVRREDDVLVPDPMRCSGFIVNDGSLEQIDQCICCDCWSPFYNSDVILSPNDYSSDEKFNRVLLGKIPVDRIYFTNKFYLKVEQLSVTDEVYNFWDLVASTKEASENIFQPNVVKVKGNMRCVSDENEEVYGIFSAASVVQDERFIYRVDFPKKLAKQDTLIADCRTLYPGATNQKPPFW